MLHIRLLDVSSVSFGLAGGASLMARPLPAGLMAAGAMVAASFGMLTMRDSAPRLPARGHRSPLAPFEGAREVTREPDAAPVAAPANSNLTPFQALQSDFRMAPATEREFRIGDQVDFIVDDWQTGERSFHGRIEQTFSFSAKIRVADEEVYLVPMDCLVLVEAAQ